MKTIFSILFVCISLLASSQNARFTQIQNKLDSLSNSYDGLNNKVELSVSGVTLQELVRGIASTNALNVSVDPKVSTRVVNNFANAPVKDVFMFLCREYGLTIRFTGSIMYFTRYIAPAKSDLRVDKIPKVDYDPKTNFISLDLKGDTLYKVAKQITSISPLNVIVESNVQNERVSAFIRNRPFDNALEKFAMANQLVVTKSEDNFYIISKGSSEASAANRTSKGSKTGQQVKLKSNGDAAVEALDNGRLNISARAVPINELIELVSQEGQQNFFLFSAPTEPSTFYLENASYEDFLSYVLNGTDFTYKKNEGVYLIGERGLERLRSTEIITLNNRTVESILDYIPEELKTGVDVKEFLELNALIASGSVAKIEELKSFVRSIDLVVPVVLIDVMIVEVQKNFTVSGGIKAGFDGNRAPTSTTGYLNDNGSGLNVNLTNRSLNELLTSMGGFGPVNLGRLNSNFYLSIQALEQNGILKKKSTPKLATLNGHEASLTLGQTEYYLEVNSNVIGAQNPTVATAQVYKPLNADLSVVVTPYVSGEEMVTLEIEYEQSSFTNRISELAPPGNQSRNFKSIIRVRDGETILLGGLDEKGSQSSGSGLPFIARIPVLKWFFGQTTRSRNKSQINILLKPTIIY